MCGLQKLSLGYVLLIRRLALFHGDVMLQVWRVSVTAIVYQYYWCVFKAMNGLVKPLR